MEPYQIGVDIGTGSVKAVALTQKNEVLARAQVYYPSFSSQSGIAEQDPQVISKYFFQCLQQVLKTVEQQPSVISLSSYMHGIMAIEENGMPLTNIITWADIRSESI